MSTYERFKEFLSVKFEVRKKLAPLYAIYPLDYQTPQMSWRLDAFVQDALINGDDKVRQAIIECENAMKLDYFSNSCESKSDANSKNIQNLLDKTDAFVNALLEYDAKCKSK